MQKIKTDVFALEKARSMTADGRNWLTLALDPFHDYPHQAAGYPDADSSQTVVSCYQYQTIVKAPDNCVGNWDCHLFSLPLTSAQVFDVGQLNDKWTGFAIPATANQITLSALNIYSAPVSAPALIPGTPANVGASLNCLPSSGYTDASAGSSRIIGAGFEVANTTAEMYKQGSVTVYRMPQFSEENCMAINKTAAEYGTVAGRRWRKPPGSLSEAQLLKGSHTWPASEGSYSVLAQNSIANPLKQLSTQHQLFGDGPNPVAGSTSVSWSSIVEFPSLSGNVATVVPGVSKTAPFDVSGAFYSGLSNSTTLTVTLKLYVERAPTHKERDLAVLASPSAGYDSAALELYSYAISMLPVGVKLAENAAGDWWRSILRVIGKVASPLGLAAGAFGIPVGPLVGKAVQTFAGSLADAASSSRQLGNSPPSIRNSSRPNPPSKKKKGSSQVSLKSR